MYPHRTKVKNDSTVQGSTQIDGTETREVTIRKTTQHIYVILSSCVVHILF